jgi:hypothetical protein
MDSVIVPLCDRFKWTLDYVLDIPLVQAFELISSIGYIDSVKSSIEGLMNGAEVKENPFEKDSTMISIKDARQLAHDKAFERALKEHEESERIKIAESKTTE